MISANLAFYLNFFLYIIQICFSDVSSAITINHKIIASIESCLDSLY